MTPPPTPPPTPPVTYLDHAASAPMRPEVAEAMAPFAAGWFGHPSSSHQVGRRARAALEEARDVVADLLGAAPGEVVFTAGGTEADNLAVLGVMGAAADRRPSTVVTSAVEHPAVWEPARAAARWMAGVDHRAAAVDGSGIVDLDRLDEVLHPQVALVSVMLANNEVGALQPLAGVVARARELAPGAAVHTDAVQAAPWVDVAAAAAGCDLVSVSAHKLGGPKGAGALVVREGTVLRPLVHGGGQERERRGGTHDVAGAVGLATALAVSAAGRAGEAARVRVLRDRLADGLVRAGAVESGRRDRVLPGHCHVRFPGIDQEELLVLLDDAGVCASGGSACASGALEPSRVMAAMGVGAAEGRGGIRLSLGWTTTAADVERALAVVPAAAGKLAP
ncbi:MAG: cysteine desulfurase family protein [Acidimicrobiales bacterium]